MLLGGHAPTAATVPAKPAVRAAAPDEPQPLPSALVVERDFARDATASFQQGRYDAACGLFAEAARRVKLSADEAAAWGFCRLAVAAEKSDGGPGAEREIAAALALAPAHPKLQELGQALLARLRQAHGPASPAPAWEVVETDSFRVRHQGTKAAAEAVAAAAEARRKATFERWSGPATGAWRPKCDIHLHATAEGYARASRRPAAGRATPSSGSRRAGWPSGGSTSGPTTPRPPTTPCRGS